MLSLFLVKYDRKIFISASKRLICKTILTRTFTEWFFDLGKVYTSMLPIYRLMVVHLRTIPSNMMNSRKVQSMC